VSPNTIERYEHSLMNTYGPPRRVLVRGEGCYVWDEDGHRYLDLLGGLAVNVLGHGHPALVAAVTEQLRTLGQVSNFFATPLQVALAERLLEISWADGGRVFFANSGTEALEAAFKMARRTGRSTIVAGTGGFHGRTMGSLALTGKPAIREPFAPLPGGVVHVPYADVDALAAAVDADTAAVVLEPIQGEAGVRIPPAGYLRAARQITSRHGALLVLDEVQTGVGRTGEWFAFQHDGVRPDVVTVAKGLGGGFPIGACLGFGRAADLLGPGSHGSTFGGNPVAAAAGLAVLETVERDGLLATQAAAAALDAGFIVNPVSSDALRLAPPLVLSGDQVESFVSALPSILDTIREA
jgi:acetylornithine aminotransferase